MPRGSTPTSSASWSPSPVRRSVRSVVRVVTPTKPQSLDSPGRRRRSRSESRISGQHRRREWKEERPAAAAAAEEERSAVLLTSSSSSSPGRSVSTSRGSPQLSTSPRSSRGHARRSSSQRLVRYPGSGERTVRYPSSGERTVRLTMSPSRNPPDGPRKRSRSPAKRPRTSRSPKRRRGRSRSPSPSPLRSPARRLNTSPSPPPLRRNRNIGVFGLSQFTTNDDLLKEFGRFGRVDNVDLIRNHKSGNSKRYGFVRFRHQEDADEAMREMNGSILDGVRVRVDYSYHSGPHSKTPGFYAGYYPYRRQRSYSPTPNGTTYRFRNERGRY